MVFPMLTGLIEVGWLFLAEMTYVYYLVLRLREGLPRLLSLLPLPLLSLLVVWRAPTAFERTVYSSFLLWMLMSKLVLLAWGKGIAADPDALSSFPRFVFACQSAVRLPLDPQFIVRASSGVKKSGLGSESAGVQDEDRIEVETGRRSFNVVQKIVASHALHTVILRCVFYYIGATALLRIILPWTDPPTSEFVLDVLLGVLLYFSCLLVLEVFVLLPASIFRTELQPLFNMPLLADSLGDFWGRRWNLLVVNSLRVSVYEPTLRKFGKGKKPSIVLRAIATGATFLVSGLMHELLLFCASRRRPSWEMTSFFVLNGVGTIVERSIRAQYGLLVPRFLRRVSTLIFICVTAHWFFFPPVRRRGLLDGMADLRDSITGIERMIWL